MRFPLIKASAALCLSLLSAFAVPAAADYIVVDKPSLTLTLYSDDGSKKISYPISAGKNYGQKKMYGDYKTPEGTFSVQSIENSSRWDKTYTDWKGPEPGPYGPYFIRIKVPFARGIGIHGTDRPDLLGTRCSEGCVRLQNENVKALAAMVKPGMKVIITPDTVTTPVAQKSSYKSSGKSSGRKKQVKASSASSRKSKVSTAGKKASKQARRKRR